MQPKHSAKIPLSEVAKLEDLIEQEPARAPSEVSKRQAVAMLAPKLYEMRRKGYAWRDVAAWLSGHGLTMTAAALQRHLRGVKDASVRGGARARGKGPGDGKADASPALAASTPAAAAATAPPPKVSPAPGLPPVEPKARDFESPKGASSFTVRPDRRII
ncbi:MAG: hypothetical protein ACLP1X_07815 [Polyangiaceae bacterium]